jgi:hypothetical protein
MDEHVDAKQNLSSRILAMSNSYRCDDYLSSSLARDGLWDEPSQLWLIEPAERVEEDCDSEFMQVGSPGVDSIGFGYRKNHAGFWALHRMAQGRFQYLAETVQEFLGGWFAGRISV